ncbi:MAG: ABC transporter ATP-binding protein [Butyribacter sp.]|nr:ABC transporter ATP-binding protein [bacterium]MDY3855082.1 ABC transporter ATP-binding protein [Butyribacter sp.]
MNNTEKKEKISIRRMISNVLYVLSYAWREDKSLVVLYNVGVILDKSSEAFAFTFVLKWIINLITARAAMQQIVQVLLIAMVCFVVQLCSCLLADNFFETRIVRVTGNIQRNFIRKTRKLDLICYDHPEYFDDFVIAATQGEEMIKEALTSVAKILANIAAMLIAGGMISTINPILAVFPILGSIINVITRFAITKQEYLYDIEKKRINRKSDYSKRVFYQPEFAKEIKLTDIQTPLIDQFNEAVQEEFVMARKYGIRIGILSLINWISVFTCLQGFVVPMYIAYLALVKKTIGLGDVASLDNATSTISHRLDEMNYALVAFQKVGQYAERFRRFVEQEEHIESFVGRENLPEDCTLQLKNVSYKYEGASQYSLQDINMTIHPGEHIAIVGENGAGKTTLIKLLMRLYEVEEGEITYGGENIQEFTTKTYRDKIGAVFQDYQIYAGTLQENIVMDDSKMPEEKVLQALEQADFMGKYEKLPKGLDTELTREFSNEGTMLSGGEAQKVAISRMFLKGNDKKIAILDEPSSALDPIAEYTLTKNMMEQAQGATIIFISHRLSTTRDADRIYMFAKGRIVEQGTHEELMKMQGAYVRMFEKQAEKYCY